MICRRFRVHVKTLLRRERPEVKVPSSSRPNPAAAWLHWPLTSRGMELPESRRGKACQDSDLRLGLIVLDSSVGLESRGPGV